MNCKKCGKEIPDKSAFCPECGAKQVDTYKEVFVRNGLAEKDFIENINKWFQWHPKAANIKCTFNMNTDIGLLVNKYTLNQVVLEYELFDKENSNQYGLVKEETLALAKQSIKEYVGKWTEEHPNCKVVTWQGGTHTRGSTASHLLGGLGARNRMSVYILFKFPRNK